MWTLPVEAKAHHTFLHVHDEIAYRCSGNRHTGSNKHTLRISPFESPDCNSSSSYIRFRIQNTRYKIQTKLFSTLFRITNLK